MSAELVGPGQFEPLLTQILAAAADITGTDKGNIQIFDPIKKTLRIVVHQGLGTRLVEHFREDGWDASCGEAAKQVQRLIVEDVEKLDVLRGTIGLEIVLEDGIRSIQCTPLVSRDGRLLGMLNNHYRWAGGPSPEALRYIDLLARQAAELIERHQVETELALARRRKEEFLAMLAHELRNPLAPLRNILEVLKRSERDNAVALQARDVMERQVSLLSRLVDDLLDVNRINRGKLELRNEILVLGPVLQQAIEVCRPLLTQQDHKLHLRNVDVLAMVWGDSARLTQVFSNLLTNACKYTPRGGDIEVEVMPPDSYVKVVVRDNGTGIPPDELDSIFEMFTQVDRTLDRAQGGLGIGLMLVKQLVEMHGGSVQARSEGSGRGSEFIVQLPTCQAAQAPVLPKPTAPAPPRRILVVDDNKDVARSLVTLLTMDGHEARAAYSGAEAVEVAQEIRPEVIFMDIGMPSMNGHQTCRRIREFDWGKGISLVALTGWGQDDDRLRSEQAGFDAHLFKPLEFDDLERVLTDLPSRSRKGSA